MQRAELPETTIPYREPRQGSPIPPRRAKASLNGSVNIIGAAAASFSVTWLLFGWLAPLSGLIGFVVVNYALFLLVYATLVSLADDAIAVRDRVATVVLCTAAILMMSALVSVVFYTVAGHHWSGARAVVHLNFFTQDLRKAGPQQSLKIGGIKHALVGTLWMISIAMGLTVPVGLVAAVYLNEVGGRLARTVRTVVEAMTGLPSIVAGLFIFATYVLFFHEHTGMAAALALAVDALPIIIRSADVVLRLVPGNLREASAALGAPDWRTARHVVLPTARSGLATAVILGMARALGETAPVLLTAGYTTYLNTNPLHGPMVSLPLATYELIKSGEPNLVARGFGAAVVLLALVIIVFSIARAIGGRGPGQLSRRQVHRARRASVRDANRIIRRHDQLALVANGQGRASDGGRP